jgi:hypothetical protein
VSEEKKEAVKGVQETADQINAEKFKDEALRAYPSDDGVELEDIPAVLSAEELLEHVLEQPGNEEAQKKAVNIHLKTFPVGDVENRWRETNLPGMKCVGCGSLKVAVRYVVFMPAKEFVKRAPEQAALIAHANDGKLPVAKFHDQPYYAISDVAACDYCKGEAARAAAKMPSWVIVEERRAPRAKALVQVDGFLGRRR